MRRRSRGPAASGRSETSRNDLSGLAFAVFAAASIMAAPDATGSIKGRIRLSGPDPGNRVIRMGHGSHVREDVGPARSQDPVGRSGA